MRVLTLTWEFPPVITGGLGMACYGIVKALLKQGIEVDLVIPAKEDVYFPLRKPEDADTLPVAFLDPSKQKLQNPLPLDELRKLMGSTASVYAQGVRTKTRYAFEKLKQINPFKNLVELLSDEYYLFREVRHYTNMAVTIGSQLSFDAIHAHDWLTYPAGMVLKRICGKPLVAHVHATEFDRAGGAGDGRIHHIEYVGMDYADRVIAVSAYTARTIQEKYHIDPEKTRVVHNAYMVPNSNGHQRRLFKEPTVLFMGRITLQKGPDYFIEVARRVLQQEKNVRFIMAGSGDMEKQVLHKAASFGMGTKFLFAGFLDRQEVESILSTTDIFVLPSVSEPFGIAPLEAMSRGAVAIISKNAGVAEVIKNAYKIDFWDIDQMVNAILELVRNPDKLREMSKKSKQEVANLLWEDAVRKISDVFREVGKNEPCLM